MVVVKWLPVAEHNGDSYAGRTEGKGGRGVPVVVVGSVAMIRGNVGLEQRDSLQVVCAGDKCFYILHF